MIASVLGLFAIIVCVTALVALIIWALVQGVRFIRSSNESLKAVTQSNASLVRDLQQIAAVCPDDTLGAKVRKTAEHLRFSDSAIAMPIDEAIHQEIAHLSKSVNARDADATEKALDAIEQLVIQRNADIALERRGSF